MTYRLKKSEPTEAYVLSVVLATLARHPMVAKVWRQNVGAGKLVRRGGTSQFIRFGFPGCPDIHGYMKDGRAIYCEVKRPSGVVKPEQAAFIQQAKASGCIAFVARSVDDVMRELKAKGE